MRLDFYYASPSPPCRAVLLTARAIGVSLNKKVINPLEGEQLKPDYLEINPQHIIPTLVDGDLTLWESRAICSYLSSQYGNDVHYSKKPKERAKIDRLLYFDIGTLFPRFTNYVYPVAFSETEKEPDKEKEAKLQEALGYLDAELLGNKFATGDKITIADHSLAASISTMIDTGIDFSKHRNITSWMARCKSSMRGYEEENGAGSKYFGDFLKSKGNF